MVASSLNTPTNRAASQSVNPLSILWIDDEVTSTDASVAILNGAGISVQCVRTAGEGLSAIKTSDPAGIFLDLRLPDMPGLKALDLLMAQRPGARVLILTGYPDLEAARLAGGLGAAMFRSKPLVGDELVRAAKELLGIESRGDAASLPAISAFGCCSRERKLITNLQAVLGTSCSTTGCGSSGTGRLVREVLLDAIVAGDLSVPAFVDCARAFRRIGQRPGECVQLAHILALRLLRTIDCAPQLSRAVREAIRLIESATNPRAYSVERIADEIGRERLAFGGLFRIETGLSVREWRNGAAIRMAAICVVDCGERFSQIAYKIGYEHHSQFDREFGHLLGSPPKAFRELFLAQGRQVSCP